MACYGLSLDKNRNAGILRELKINSVLEHIDQYRNNWKQHVQRMDRSCIPPQIMTYRPKGKRSLGTILSLSKKMQIKYKILKRSKNQYI
jgi:hypothetical protein